MTLTAQPAQLPNQWTDTHCYPGTASLEDTLAHLEGLADQRVTGGIEPPVRRCRPAKAAALSERGTLLR